MPPVSAGVLRSRAATHSVVGRHSWLALAMPAVIARRSMLEEREISIVRQLRRANKEREERAKAAEERRQSAAEELRAVEEELGLRARTAGDADMALAMQLQADEAWLVGDSSADAQAAAAAGMHCLKLNRPNGILLG